MTSDLFDPTLWQNWALLLAVLIGLGWGYSVASLEDQRRRQQKRKGQRTRSRRSQASVPNMTPSGMDATMDPSIAPSRSPSMQPALQTAARPSARMPMVPQRSRRRRAKLAR